MKTLPISLLRNIAAVLAAALLTAIPVFAQENAASPAVATSPVAAPSGQPSAADMQKMMAQMVELSKLNENHKVLASLSGNWTDVVKMWMNPDPKAPPIETKGSVVRKPIMDGRYFVADFTGKMKMPGPDGKMRESDFKGHSIEGYDNVKQKFVATWIDNMGTGIMSVEGTYDPATKTFTYTGAMEPMPGMKTKIRETIKIVDNNHHNFEWYEDHGSGEVKTMEIAYTRKK